MKQKMHNSKNQSNVRNIFHTPVLKKRIAPLKKEKIPVALREAIWIKNMGRVFEGKCPTSWCLNNITVFDFHSGHDIPESKGGPTTIENLIPLCARCNLSMGAQYTFQEWSTKFSQKPKQREQPLSQWQRIYSFFTKPRMSSPSSQSFAS